jgi:hypothetical protein
MLAAVKNAAARLVGAERSAPSYEAPRLDREALEEPVTTARERAQLANQQHRDSMARVDETKAAIREAEASFDAAGDEEHADEIVKLKRELERRELFSQRTQRAAVTAAGAVEQAVTARDAALLAHFDDRVNGVSARLHDLWRHKGYGALKAFEDFMIEADALIVDAQAANQEARTLNRGSHTDASARSLGLEALRAVLGSWVTDALSPQMRPRVERLFR